MTKNNEGIEGKIHNIFPLAETRIKQIIQEVRKHDRERLIEAFKKERALRHGSVGNSMYMYFSDIEHIIRTLCPDAIPG